jgi:predicted transport protein
MAAISRSMTIILADCEVNPKFSILYFSFKIGIQQKLVDVEVESEKPHYRTNVMFADIEVKLKRLADRIEKSIGI